MYVDVVKTEWTRSPEGDMVAGDVEKFDRLYLARVIDSCSFICSSPSMHA